jgi:3-methyl-2-oxobutanoate hydroxymethyltransferase
LQRERVAAFGEYIADVKEGRFPERSHLVEMDEMLLQEVVRSIAGK